MLTDALQPGSQADPMTNAESKYVHEEKSVNNSAVGDAKYSGPYVHLTPAPTTRLWLKDFVIPS